MVLSEINLKGQRTLSLVRSLRITKLSELECTWIPQCTFNHKSTKWGSSASVCWNPCSSVVKIILFSLTSKGGLLVLISIKSCKSSTSDLSCVFKTIRGYGGNQIPRPQDGSKIGKYESSLQQNIKIKEFPKRIGESVDYIFLKRKNEKLSEEASRQILKKIKTPANIAFSCHCLQNFITIVLPVCVEWILFAISIWVVEKYLML